MGNPLYDYYQQGNRQPLGQLQTNQKATQAATEGDTDFKDIWNYLKWLKRGYDFTAKQMGNPTVSDYISKAWDSMSGEAGADVGASASDMAATEAYDSAFSGAAAEGAGEGAAGMGAGSWASVAAPLVATWAAYTRGSGRNEPVEKRMESLGAIPLIKNIAEGQNINPNDLWASYRQSPRYLPGSGGGPGELIDPNYKPNIGELWHQMHYSGTGHKQNTGDSGLTDSQIDEMILNSGVSQEDLLKALGINALPDWSKQSYDTWYAGNYGGSKEKPLFMGDNYSNWL